MQVRNIPLLLNDLYLVFGTDLTLSATGDLQIANGAIRSEQRVIRRLLTNPGDYIWHPTYGAGLPAYVGQALSPDLYNQIQSTTLQNIFLEDSVSQNPMPDVLFQTAQGGIFVQINYTLADTQQPIVVTFNAGNLS